MEINQEDAIQLLERCALLIIAGVPNKTQFGMKCNKSLEFLQILIVYFF